MRFRDIPSFLPLLIIAAFGAVYSCATGSGKEDDLDEEMGEE
jgi:hypothetical protein